MNSINIGSFYRWGMLENYSRHIVQVMKGSENHEKSQCNEIL